MVTSNITAPQNKADLKPVTVNRYGTLDELIKIHREDIGVGKVVPMLPFVFFRIGSVNSPPDKWYFALLNRDQLRSSEEVIENYRNGGDVEVLPKEVLDFTLSEMLGRHLFPTQDVMADYSVSYDAALDVVYGRDADKPTIKSNHEGKRILYSLQDNPSEVTRLSFQHG